MLARRDGISNTGPGPVQTSPTPYTPTTTMPVTTSIHPEHNPGVPQIGGSSAGFIALVSVLAAFVVLCCVGVFILLRTHNPTRYERRLREAEQRARGSSLYETPLGPPGMRERFKRWFGGKRGAGWVRASGDEWEAADDAPLGHVTERKSAPAGADPEVSQHVPPHMRDRDMSAESVELEAARDEHSPHAPPLSPPDHAQYSDPYSDSPVALDGQRADGESRGENSRFSVQTASSGHGEIPSIRSMRKFEGGTKFRESLE